MTLQRSSPAQESIYRRMNSRGLLKDSAQGSADYGSMQLCMYVLGIAPERRDRLLHELQQHALVLHAELVASAAAPAAAAAAATPQASAAPPAAATAAAPPPPRHHTHLHAVVAGGVGELVAGAEGVHRAVTRDTQPHLYKRGGGVSRRRRSESSSTTSTASTTSTTSRSTSTTSSSTTNRSSSSRSR